MKKFFIFVCASMLCFTSFAEDVNVENSAEPSAVEMTSETLAPVDVMGPNDDGFIYKGTITLTRVVSGIRETFYLYNRRGVDYVAPRKNGPFYRLEYRMTINGIDYKL